MPFVTMPQLGETVTEGTVGKWLKKPGDQVKKYEPLLDVETDKVASEIPSPYGGVLTRIIAEEGATVPVGAQLCEIEEVSAAKDASAARSDAPVKDSGSTSSAAGAVAASGEAVDLGRPKGDGAADDGARYSPAVRKLAREHGVDLRSISGTGRSGRVTANDVLAAAEAAPVKAAATVSRPAAEAAPAAEATPAADARPAADAKPAAAAEAKPAPSTTEARPAASTVDAKPPAPREIKPVPVAPPSGEDSVIRLTLIRKTIADRMALSRFTIPFAWSLVEVDVTDVAKWREREKEAFKKREGANLTFVPIVVHAVCAGLKEVPIINSAWAGDHIIVRKRINVGIAVDTDDGLVVPVVRDADRLSVAGLATSIATLVDKARRRKLTMEDLADGTITVNNTGAIGSIVSVPIINPPQAAIFAMESVVKRPWVVHDAIGIRSIMNVSLCFDHRVFDGGTASQFLQAVRRRLEGPPPSI